MPKFVYEMSILIIFLSLFRSFNALSADYQADQRGKSSGKFICIAKVIFVVLCLIYFVNALLFNIVGPTTWYLDSTKDGKEQAK